MSHSQSPFESSRAPSPPRDGNLDEEYLELSQALRRLAVCLADTSSADDLVQEAWLAALDTPPGKIRDLNAWLRLVLRRIASRERRKGVLRRDVELMSHSDVEAPFASADAEHRSVQEFLHDAVEKLREPNRQVIRMRFFEEHSVAEIATRLQRPEPTVRTQLRRGIAELREVLDRSHGGVRSAWAPLLLEAVHGEGGLESAATGQLGSQLAVMTARVLIASLVIGVPALLWFQPWRAQESEAVAQLPKGPAPIVDNRQEVPVEEPEGFVSEDRLAVDVPAPADLEPVPTEDAALAAAPAGTRRLEVIVRLENGLAAKDAELRLSGGSSNWSSTIQSDANGRLAVDLREEQLAGPPLIQGPGPGLVVMARAAGHAWSHQYLLPIPPQGRVFEIVSRGPAQSIGGKITDVANRPVVGAELELLPQTFVLQRTEDDVPFRELPFLTATDASGEFLIEGLAIKRHLMQLKSPGLVSQTLTIEEPSSDVVLEIVMEAGARISGVVTHEDGRPAVGARVWTPPPPPGGGTHRDASALTDEFGRYELLGLPAEEIWVFATDSNDESLFRCAMVELKPNELLDLDLSLSSADGVQVQVTEEDGTPVPGARVVLATSNPPFWMEMEFADDDGRVHILHTASHVMTMVVARPVVDRSAGQWIEGVRSSPEPRVVVLPPEVSGVGSLSGTVLDSEGNPFPLARAMGDLEGPLFDVSVDEVSGAFQAENLFPGSYVVSLVVEDFGGLELGVHEVTAGEQTTLDLFRAPPMGILEIEWGDVAPSLEAPWTLKLYVERSALRYYNVLELTDPWEELELLPASYVLEKGGEYGTGSVPFTIESNAVTSFRPGK